METMNSVERFARHFRTKITLLVPLLLLAMAWFWGPSALALPWLIAGLLCVLCGIAFRLWASGYLIKDDLLVQWGPFSYTRNPLYIGTLLIGVGFASLTGRWESFVLLALIFTIYLPTVRYEEHVLATRYGDAYREYTKMVPRWLPRLTPAPVPADVLPHYQWSLVKHHHEHVHFMMHLTLMLAFVAVHLLKVAA